MDFLDFLNAYSRNLHLPVNVLGILSCKIDNKLLDSICTTQSFQPISNEICIVETVLKLGLAILLSTYVSIYLPFLK